MALAYFLSGHLTLAKPSISFVIGEGVFLALMHLLSTIEQMETFCLWPVFAVSIHFNSVAPSGFWSGFSCQCQLQWQPPWSPWAVKLRGQADRGLMVSFVEGIRNQELGMKGEQTWKAVRLVLSG